MHSTTDRTYKVHLE